MGKLRKQDANCSKELKEVPDTEIVLEPIIVDEEK